LDATINFRIIINKLKKYSFLNLAPQTRNYLLSVIVFDFDR